MTQKVQVLVVGITGIAGSYIAQHLLAAGCQVSGLARRTPADPVDGVNYLQADLADPDSLSRAIQNPQQYTHVVYAGFAAREGANWSEVTAWNAQLFDTLMTFARHQLTGLQRVLLMQGQKYYGSHLGPFRTPTRESDPRHSGENFYFNQQDSLIEAAQQCGWSWSALRPHIVCGVSLHASMNPLVLIGAYASLCKALGEPLTFPGKAAAYDTLYQASDADLLGRAGVWALLNSDAANQAYNITNGDLFRWRHVWERLADTLQMPLGAPQSRDVADFFNTHAALWRDIAQQQNLQQSDLQQLGDWHFLNYILGCDWDIAASTVKARLHGFQDCRDSLEMWSSRIVDMQQQRILPAWPSS